MIMFERLHGSVHEYLAGFCVRTYLVPGRSALRSAAHCGIVVPSHQTDFRALRSFVVTNSGTVF